MSCYSELIQIDDYYERFRYLKIGGVIGDATFGFNRYLNQTLYRSKEWREARNQVIIRDDGLDMGHPDFPINGRIIVHHIKPITEKDVSYGPSKWIFDPEYLICVSMITHEAIHYGDESLLPRVMVERYPNDTCPWKLRK